MAAGSFTITLHYLMVDSADFAVRRVAARVAAGGHGVAEVDIRRRYVRSLDLFDRVYRSAVDLWYLYEAHESRAQLIASSERR